MKILPSLRPSLRRLAGLVLLGLVALFAGAIGTGRIAFEVTHGVSMQPTYHTGDLVVVARATSYHNGQIVAYHGGQNDHLVVLHRIIGMDPSGGFVIKGDNNESIDPIHPVADQLIGREVLHIPKVGAVLSSPIARGLMLLALLGLVVALIKNPRPPPTGADVATAPVPRHRVRVWKVLAGLDVLLLVAVALSFVLASQAPPHSVNSMSTQTGVLTYQAKVPLSDTYPTGRIETGDPVFVKLLKTLGVSFQYSTHAPPGAVHGVGWIDAVLSEASGWHTNFSIAPPTPLLAGKVGLTGTLDLVGLQNLADRVAKATGMTSGTLDITVTASTRVTVHGSKPITYSSQLPLELTPLELTLAGAKPSSSTYGPAVTSTVSLSPASPASSHPSGSGSDGPRLALLAAFLLCVGATVVAWPTSGDDPRTPPLRRYSCQRSWRGPGPPN